MRNEKKVNFFFSSSNDFFMRLLHSSLFLPDSTVWMSVVESYIIKVKRRTQHLHWPEFERIFSFSFLDVRRLWKLLRFPYQEFVPKKNTILPASKPKVKIKFTTIYLLLYFLIFFYPPIRQPVNGSNLSLIHFNWVGYLLRIQEWCIFIEFV